MNLGTHRRALGRHRVLELEGVSVRFGELQALNAVALTVAEGELVALIGPNGAGKTTCFNAISGFVAPSSGRIRLDGRRINTATPAQRAQAGIARTFQNIGLDKRSTVIDNLRVAFESSLATKTLTARHEFDAHCRYWSQRLGLIDLLEQRAGHLPIGTAKMVELACTLIRRPRVLLLDEPSSGLGPDARSILRDVLLELREQRDLAILVIEHDMNLATSVADRMYVLNFGTPLAHGTPQQIVTNTAVIEAYLGVDA